ncbi:MAG: DMT family transporter [Nitrospira sp.]|nr:DMT family transporter [Nitrospira sp.]
MMSPTEQASESRPLLYVTTAVLMLSTVSPITKSLLQHHDIAPFDLVCLRVLIAFSCLFAITLMGPWQELFQMPGTDIIRLTLLGILGVGAAYGFAGLALAYTSVSHYTLIYSLNPTFTALFSLLLKKDQASTFKTIGISLSLAGCLLAIPVVTQDQTVGFGDLLALLFTISASACVVLSTGMVKRYGAVVATTVMFGSSLCFLLLAAMFWSIPARFHVSLSNGLLIAYVGIATAAVFFFRNLSLKSLTPATVGAFHNLVPILVILTAYWFLDEPVTSQMVVGGLITLSGVELVRRG